ncbi:hypothetical protein BDW72DRAFT_166603 [Aspergillus terricola var. indicus]
MNADLMECSCTVSGQVDSKDLKRIRKLALGEPVRILSFETSRFKHTLATCHRTPRALLFLTEAIYRVRTDI